MALAINPKAFSLTELSKGYFPHPLNLLEDHHCVASLLYKNCYHFNNTKSTFYQETFLEKSNDITTNANYIFYTGQVQILQVHCSS